MFYIGLYRENMKKSSFRKPKAKSLDIWYVASPSGHLPSLFNFDPGVKNGPASHVLYRLIWGKQEKIFLSENTKSGALIFVM